MYGVWVTLKKHGENSVPVDHLQRVTPAMEVSYETTTGSSK